MKICDSGSANVPLTLIGNVTYIAPERLPPHLSFLALPLKNRCSCINSPVNHCITHGEGSGCSNVGTREDVPIGEKKIVIVGMRGVVAEDITGSVAMGTRGAVVWITGDVPMNTTECVVNEIKGGLSIDLLHEEENDIDVLED